MNRIGEYIEFSHHELEFSIHERFTMSSEILEVWQTLPTNRNPHLMRIQAVLSTHL